MALTQGQNYSFGTSTYTPAAQQDIFSAMRNAEDLAKLQFQPYLGQTVAGFAPSQIAAMQGVYGMQGYAEPYIQGAGALLQQAQAYADPRRYTQEAIQQYYNPYQQNVINATMANIAQENLRQQNDLTSRAIQQGAFGSDRTGIARAELNRLQNLQNAQTLAGLQAQGYQQAQAQYNAQQQAAIDAAQKGAYSLGQLGTMGQQAALQGIQALMGVGGMEQQLGQQMLADQFKRYMTAQGYPWEVAQFVGSLVGALGPQAGGTTTSATIGGSSQETQGASPLSQILGAAMSGLGLVSNFIPGMGKTKKDGGRINKDSGGSFGDIMSLGLEDPWYGFDPRQINEEKQRQWLSRQPVDKATKQQLKDRSWLNPDENLDPYQGDEIDYSQDDGGPVLMSSGGRAKYEDGGGLPYRGGDSYLAGNTEYIPRLKLPSPPAPHRPSAPELRPPSLSAPTSSSSTLGDLGKLLSSFKFGSKKQSSGTSSSSAETTSYSPSEDQTEEQYGGRVNKDYGGGFSDWLASLRGGADSTPGMVVSSPAGTPQPPYLPKPAQQPLISDIGQLYKYAFGREADPEGLKYWQQQQSAGLGLSDIAQAFASSPEAIGKYGQSNIGEFGNLLQRGLSDPSKVTQTYQPKITNVSDLYKYTFGREPDPSGLEYWQQQQQSGMNLSDIGKIFASSPEALAKYGETGVSDLAKNIQSGLLPPSKANPQYQTLLTTGGAPVVNPDGTPVTLADVQAPSSIQGDPSKNVVYSEGDIAAAGNISGPDPGLLMQVGKNPMLAFLINQQQQQKQEEANRKVAQMRAHNASIYNAPRTPIGYFMNLDYSTMSPSGLFGFNPISPYYSPIVPNASTGVKAKNGGIIEEKAKGFEFGGEVSANIGQLPNVMTGHGSQTNPSSFRPGYNPQAFYQQRSDGGRTGYARGGQPTYGVNDLVNIAKAAGATPREAALLASIAMAESSGNPKAWNPKGRDLSYGLWQINMLGRMGPERRSRYGLTSNSQLFDPVTNAKVALDLLRHTKSGIHNWTTFTSGKYRPFYEAAQRAAGQPYSEPPMMSRDTAVAAQAPSQRGFVPRLLRALSPVSTAQAGESVLTRINPADPSGPLLPEKASAQKPMRGYAENYIMDRGQPRTKDDLGLVTQPQGYETFKRQPEWYSKSMGASKDRTMLPETPETVTSADFPMSAEPMGTGFEEPVVSTDAGEQAVSTETKERRPEAPGRTYWGDYRDVENNPLGDFIDMLAGDVRKAEKPGTAQTPMGKFAGEGGLGALFDLEGMLPANVERPAQRGAKESVDQGIDLGSLFDIFQ